MKYYDPPPPLNSQPFNVSLLTICLWLTLFGLLLATLDPVNVNFKHRLLSVSLGFMLP